MTPRGAREPGRWRRLGPMVALALLSGVFILHFPDRLYGDDAFFVRCIVRHKSFPPHFLFLPLARGASWVGAHAGLDPFVCLRLLSALGTAGAAVLLFLAARRRDVPPGPSLLVPALVVTAPSTWFFATAAEVHGLHLGAVALLVWALAGLRPHGPPRRVLVAALSFGVVVGTHQSGVLLLPGAIALYLLFTAGRGATQRRADLLAFLAGGLVSLAGMLLANLASTGSLLNRSDSPLAYLRGFAAKFESGFGPDQMTAYLGSDWVAPSFALALLGALALGSLLRTDRRLFAVLAAALVPYGAFFALWTYREQGAYFLVTLPSLAAATILCATSKRGAPRIPNVLLAHSLLAAALLGSVLDPDVLLDVLGAGGLVLLALAAFAAGALWPATAILSGRRAALPAVLLVLAQLAGAETRLGSFDREQPMLDWARDACEEIGGEDTALVLTGFQQYMLMLLLYKPWPAPYTDTWAFQRDLPPAPMPFDIQAGGPRNLRKLDELIQSGTEVYLLEDVVVHLQNHPVMGQAIRHLRETYDWQTVSRGSFEAHRLVPRP